MPNFNLPILSKRALVVVVRASTFNNRWPWAIGLIGLFFSTAAVAVTTEAEGPAASIPVISALVGGIQAPQFQACLGQVASNQCQPGDTNCISQLLAKQKDCQQVLALYQATTQMPLAVRLYNNIAVAQMTKQSYVFVDQAGHLITPFTQLSMENTPGVLDLQAKVPHFALSAMAPDFPEAVYLSPSSTQIVFLQDMVDASCTQDCRPVAIAKVLYGFNVNGNFINARLLRIMPLNQFE